MEKVPGSAHNNLETLLIGKYGLHPGKQVAFEKVAQNAASAVPVGAVTEGVVKDLVRVGAPIVFENGAVMSQVRKVEERGGELFIHTNTSIYRLRKEKRNSIEDFSIEDISIVETAKGSKYRYLADGTTQRFKAVEGREYDPQSALVYVPDYAWVKEKAVPEVLKKLGENEFIYVQTLLEYIHHPHGVDQRVYIVDATGKKLETNKEISDATGPVYLSFIKNGKTDFSIPVTQKPRIGFCTFDTRTYRDPQTGEYMRERHLGNKVVRIVLKNGKVVT